MGFEDDIKKKVSTILDEKFEVEEVTSVPDIANPKLTFGNKGLEFEATVLYIDMRGSTEVLNSHNKPVVAKIHMAYFHTIVKIANSLGGEVRSFNGDSMLVFFAGTTKEILNKAVQAAMQMVYMIGHEENGINKMLSKYTKIDFGIGLDDGKILCTKIGVGGDSNNKDLIWIGNPVNKSTVLSDHAKKHENIYISKRVYECLNDDMKYYNTSTNAWGEEVHTDMWQYCVFEYNGQTESCYHTSYCWTVG